MTGKQEGPYKGEETTAEEDKVWQLHFWIKMLFQGQQNLLTLEHI